MTISQNFHMSQVHGASKELKKRLSLGGGPHAKPQCAGDEWKLSETNEWRRSNILERLKDLRIDTSAEIETAFPTSLRRRLLVGRTMQVSRNVTTRRHPPVVGRTQKILQVLEAAHSTVTVQSGKASRSRKTAESALDVLFPLTISDCSAPEDSVVSYVCAPVPMLFTAASARVITKPSMFDSVDPVKSRQSSELADRRSDAVESLVPCGAQSTFVAALGSIPAAAIAQTLPCNPYASRSKSASTGRVGSSQSIASASDDPYLEEQVLFTIPVPLVRNDDTGRIASSKMLHPVARDAERREFMAVDAGEEALVVDEFRLPSQHDSSSDSSDDECDIDVAAATTLKPQFVCENSFRRPTQCIDEDNVYAQVEVDDPATHGNPVDDAFCLPTPEPSSDEEDCDADGEGDMVDETLLPSSSPQQILNDVNVSIFEDVLLVLPARAQDPSTFETTQDSSVLRCSPKSIATRVRFSMRKSVLVDGVVLVDTPQSDATRKKMKLAKRIRAIDDTPDSKQSPASPRSSGIFDDGLSNTQDSRRSDSGVLRGVNLVCAVCLTDVTSEIDPIILCDGQQAGVRCNLAVHSSCYDANVDLNDDNEWLCNRCEFRNGTGQSLAIEKCCICLLGGGALKRTAEGEWKHVKCWPAPVGARMKRLRQDLEILNGERAAVVRRPLSDLSPNGDSKDGAAMRMKRRRHIMRQFIDDEADASDTEGDQEEEYDALAIEEEEKEFAKHFINDSTQLGFTPDELDQADPNVEDAHHALDAERERRLQFATPLFNRRMREQQQVAAAADDSPWSDTSAPDSARGLGNMHFIRSVLEHHRHGGDAEDIEEFYQKVAG